MPQGGVAAAEQRLCSGGTTGCGVLGLGMAAAWGDGALGRARACLRREGPGISKPRLGMEGRR